MDFLLLQLLWNSTIILRWLATRLTVIIFKDYFFLKGNKIRKWLWNYVDWEKYRWFLYYDDELSNFSQLILNVQQFKVQTTFNTNLKKIAQEVTFVLLIKINSHAIDSTPQQSKLISCWVNIASMQKVQQRRSKTQQNRPSASTYNNCCLEKNKINIDLLCKYFCLRLIQDESNLCW